MINNRAHDFDRNYTEFVEKAQNRFYRSYRQKREIIAFLQQLQDRNVCEHVGYDYDRFIHTFGSGKRFANLKDRLLGCGSILTFRWYYRANKTKLHHANFCTADKLCAPCAVRRAYKQQRRFVQALEHDEALKRKNWYYIVIPDTIRQSH